jgi:hypothetical protein
MRPHPKASLVLLLVGIGFVIAFFVSLPLWNHFYEPRSWFDPTPIIVMGLLCGVPFAICVLISLGLGVHAVRMHRWVLVWIAPLLCAAAGSILYGVIGLAFGPNHAWPEHLSAIAPGCVAVLVSLVAMYFAPRR